jgi:hypothetical protein
MQSALENKKVFDKITNANATERSNSKADLKEQVEKTPEYK